MNVFLSHVSLLCVKPKLIFLWTFSAAVCRWLRCVKPHICWTRGPEAWLQIGVLPASASTGRTAYFCSRFLVLDILSLSLPPFEMITTMLNQAKLSLPFVLHSGDPEVWFPGGAVQVGCGAVALGYGPGTGLQEAGNQHQFGSSSRPETVS